MNRRVTAALAEIIAVLMSACVLAAHSASPGATLSPGMLGQQAVLTCQTDATPDV